jgi:hypothetical protein
MHFETEKDAERGHEKWLKQIANCRAGGLYRISSRSLFALANGGQFYTLEGNRACPGAAGP